MSKQLLLSLLLIVQTLALLVYTFYAGTANGWDFSAVAIQNVQALDWNGQFALDFSCYLVLSGLWIMWRSRFSLPSLLMAVIAMILGIVVFAPYVLYLLIKNNGDINATLVGER